MLDALNRNLGPHAPTRKAPCTPSPVCLAPAILRYMPYASWLLATTGHVSADVYVRFHVFLHISSIGLGNLLV